MNAWDEPKDRVAKFVADQKLPYTILMNGGSLYKKSYGGGGIPKTYLLNREGKISSSHLGWGPGDEEKLAAEIEALLKS